MLKEQPAPSPDGPSDTDGANERDREGEHEGTVKIVLIE